jgi:hypothetical protein
MTQHELDADQLLGALGALQRAQRAELERLEEPARELAAREPERARALETRLIRELFAAPAAPRRLARIGRAWSLAAAGCAMAAAALLWVRAPAAFDVAYTLVPPAQDAALRALPAESSPSTGGTYNLGRELSFTLRPATRYTGPLRVLAYAARGGAVVQLDADVEHDPAGGARVTLATPSSQLSEGSWELLFYVSPPTVPAVSEAELRGRSCPGATRCLALTARFVQLLAP